MVGCAIDVIAEAGLAGASVARIAARAKVSRGVVTYHFQDKDDLVDAVVEEVYRVAQRELGPRVAAAPTPRDALLEFVAGSVEFYAAYPHHMAALVEIYAAARRSATRSRAARPRHTRELADVQELLRRGQSDGQFRRFDVPVTANVIRSMLDSAVAAVGDGADVAALRSELVAAADALTRATS